MSIIQAEHIMQNDPGHARAAHEARYARGSAYMHGTYCPVDEAAIPLLDLGFRHGDATYDVVSASKGYLFRLQDHLERFERSCAGFRLRNPHSVEETSAILTRLVQLAGTREAYIFWCVTRGFRKEGGDHNDPASYMNRFYAYVVPYRYIASDEMRTRGIDLLVSQQFIRIPPKAVDPRVKNFHWLDMQQSLFEAHDKGRDFSVLCDSEGYLTECPGANIFLIKDGVVYTPHNGCLEGITRQTAIELAREAGLPVHVERVHVSQLLDADEAFITSTAGGLMPVNSVDGRLLGGVAGPGQLATRLHNLYWQKRWDGWLGTPVEFG